MILFTVSDLLTQMGSFSYQWFDLECARNSTGPTKRRKLGPSELSQRLLGLSLRTVNPRRLCESLVELVSSRF